MNLSAPTMMVFLISVVLAILALLVQYAGISIGIGAFLIMLVAWIVLAAGCMMKGL